MNAKLFEQHCRPGVPQDLPRSRQAGDDYLKLGTHGGGSDQEFPGQGVYGLNWWFNAVMPSGERLLPHLPDDAYCTIGHVGKEVMVIVPSWKLVVAARGDWGGLRLDKTKLLREAVADGASNNQPGTPAPATPTSRAKSRGNLGKIAKWSSLEISLIGPDSRGAESPNPFDILVDVEQMPAG